MMEKIFLKIFADSPVFASFIRFRPEMEVKAKQHTFAEIYFLCNFLHLFPYNG